MTMTRKILLTCICAAAILLVAGQVKAASDDEIKVRRIEMAFSTATVRVNQERTLYVEIIPYNADDQTVYWSSSNPEVALVDGDGLITGVSPGTTEITATSGNGKTAVCRVTVPGTPHTEFDLQTSNGEHPTAEVNAGEVLSAATLRLDVETAAKAASGGSAQVAYTGKTRVSTAALRSADYAARYLSKQVSVRFRTLDGNGSIQGQLTVDPSLAGAEDSDIFVKVTTSGDAVSAAATAASSHFGAPAAAVQLAHSGGYGMSVGVAARLDLSGMEPSRLKLYHRDGGAYRLLDSQDYRIDDGGYLHFSTHTGGMIVVTG